MLITIQPVVADAYYLKTPLLDSFKAWNNVCLKSKWLILIFKPSFYPSLDIVTLNILERYNKQEIFNQSINQSLKPGLISVLQYSDFSRVICNCIFSKPCSILFLPSKQFKRANNKHFLQHYSLLLKGDYMFW